MRSTDWDDPSPLDYAIRTGRTVMHLMHDQTELDGQQGIGDIEFSTNEEFIRIHDLLRDSFNITLLGAGNFSQAWTHPTHKHLVAKVSNCRDEDGGYYYALWCKKNQGMAGVPRVYHVEKFDEYYYMVVMDKLYDWRERENAYELREEFHKIAASYGTSLPNGVEKGTYLAAVCETYHTIIEYFSDISRSDLHDANVMFDINRQWIITDPVSYSRGSAERRAEVESSLTA